MNNQKGQTIIEAVLLIALGAFMIGNLSSYFKKSEFAKKLVSEPWQNISGMVQCGTWKPCGIGSANTADHPSNLRRNRSWDKQ